MDETLVRHDLATREDKDLYVNAWGTNLRKYE